MSQLRVNVMVLGFLCGMITTEPLPCVGQPTARTIAGGPTCSACTIDRFLLATIQDTTFPGGVLGQTGDVFVNSSDSTFFVIGSLGRGELHFADRSGAIVRQVGRAGQGPGEYMWPTWVMETSSEYLIVDQLPRRVTRLTKQGLELKDTYVFRSKFPLGIPPVVFSDGSYLVLVGDRAHGNLAAIELVSPNGDITNSFGIVKSSGGELRSADFSGLLPTAMCSSGDAAFWVAYRDYRLERWDRSGNLMDSYRREAEWVRPLRSGQKPGDTYTTVTAIREDDEGRLWVHVSGRKASEPGRFSGDPRDLESIIEVLDPANGVALAESRVRGLGVVDAGGGGFFQTVRRDSPTLTTVLDIWGSRIRFRGPSSP